MGTAIVTIRRLSENDSNWTFRSIIEIDDMRAYNVYFYKRTKCYRIVVDDPKVGALSGYKLIEKDLRNCLTWLRHIKSLLEQDPGNRNAQGHRLHVENREVYNLIKGLFVASLTIYGKCFSNGEGRRIKLERNNLTEKYLEAHDIAISYRHNFAAHSGAKKIEYVNVVLVLDSKRKRGTKPELVTEMLQPDSWGIDDVEDFIALAEHAREFAQGKLNYLQDRVLREALEKGPDYWYGKVK